MNYLQTLKEKYPLAYKDFAGWYGIKTGKSWHIDGNLPTADSLTTHFPSAFQLGVILLYNKETITEEEQIKALGGMIEEDFDKILDRTWAFIEQKLRWDVPQPKPEVKCSYCDGHHWIDGNCLPF